MVIFGLTHSELTPDFKLEKNQINHNDHCVSLSRFEANVRSPEKWPDPLNANRISSWKNMRTISSLSTPDPDDTSCHHAGERG